jgi:hypothetical protein
VAIGPSDSAMAFGIDQAPLRRDRAVCLTHPPLKLRITPTRVPNFQGAHFIRSTGSITASGSANPAGLRCRLSLLESHRPAQQNLGDLAESQIRGAQHSGSPRCHGRR